MANSEAWQEGWQLGKERSDERHAHKQALSDEERQSKAQLYATQLDGLRNKISAFKQGTPEYNDTFNAMQDTMKNVRELFRPDVHPGLIASHGHLITDALHITNPKDRIQKEAAKRAAGVAGDEKATQDLVMAAPLSPEQQATTKANANAAGDLVTFNSNMKLYDQNHPEGVAPNATPEGTRARQEYANELINSISGIKETKDQLGKWDRISGKVNGKPVVLLYNEKTGKYKTQTGEDVPQEVVDGFIADPKEAKGTKLTGPQLLQDSYLATLGLPFGTAWDTLTNEQRKGYQLYLNKLKQRSANRQTAIQDRDGNVHIVDLSSSSGPVEVAPSARSAPAPSASSGASSPTQKTQGGGAAKPTKEDIVLNFKKATPDYTKAKNNFNDADRISKLADKWIKNPNSEADRNFVLALIRSEAGRVNQQEIAMMFTAGGVSIAPERWAASAIHGELPPELRKQLTDFVHLQRDASKEVLDQMNSGSGDSASGGTASPKDGSTPKGTIGTISHNGKNYWVDAKGKNLGVAP
jgi:hypothetical protein